MVVAGIVAGGTGSRMGADIPKQFLKLNGMPIVLHTAARFAVHEAVDAVVIGVHPSWVEYTEKLLETCETEMWSRYGSEDSADVVKWRTKLAVVAGGATRNDTILAILSGAKERFGADADTVVLSHDAVRPFVTAKIISNHVEAMRSQRVTTTTIPAVDTMLCSEDGAYVTGVPERKMMFHAQTPQSFRIGEFEQLYAQLPEEARVRATDVCGIYIEYGIPVYMVEGDTANRKLTYASDYNEACARYK